MMDVLSRCDQCQESEGTCEACQGRGYVLADVHPCYIVDELLALRRERDRREAGGAS